MKKSLFIIIAVTFLLFQYCSEDFLEIPVNEELNDYVLATPEGIDKLLIGAYSMVDGVSNLADPVNSTSSNWLFGDVRGLIANRGSDAADCCGRAIELYVETSREYRLYDKWKALYEGISRCNNLIRVVNVALQQGNITPDQSVFFINQAKALRGWFHFEAWRFWEKIPFVDEFAGLGTVTNQADYRDRIIADLNAGTNLPDDMKQIGRWNKTVVKVMLAKALMQMYHDYNAALPLLADVKANGTKPNGGPIGLAPTYGEIFDIEHRNGIESVYTVQYSVNDGSGGFNASFGELYNFPYDTTAPAGCCGFFQPNEEYVNSFRTFNGLPLLDYSYNDDPVINDMGFESSDTLFKEDPGPLDPRLDWSVGRRGIPYWDWGNHPGKKWIRDQSYGGPYSPKKQVYKKSQEGIYTENGNWTKGWTANGYRMIRYADVLLLLAECQIETGNLDGALENINLVRRRAANREGFVMEADGVTPAANYQISEYPSFPDVEYARKALYMERKLELGMEGHRYFDLNRWGITVEELNRVLAFEKSTPHGSLHYGRAEVGPEDVTYPIPYQEIDLSHGQIVQNRVEPEN